MTDDAIEAGGGGWRSSTSRERAAPADYLSCSFCGKAQRQTRKLIAGPHAYICDQCVAVADQVIATGQTAATELSPVSSVAADLTAIRCSFCGKTRQQVAGLAAAGDPAICTECLLLCNEILDEGPA